MKKRTTLTILSFLTLVCILVSSLISCKSKTETPPQTTEGSTSDAVTEEKEEIIDLISGGVCNFKIVRPASSLPDYIFNAFGDIRDAVKKHTGITLDISYEDDGGNEIIVGNTGREVLKELSSKYRLKDCFVGVYKNQLIIYGASETSLEKAVTQFEKMLAEKAKESKTDIKFSSLENYEYLSTSYVVDSFNIANTPLSEYCIVYSPDGRYSEELLALRLKSKLERSVGFPINVYTEKKVDKNAKKIIIGNTSYSSDVSVGEYEFGLDVKAGDLRLYADSIEGYYSLFDYLASNQLTQKDVVLEEGLTVTKSVDTNKISTKINKLGDVRVLINNILGNCDNNKYPVIYRTRSVTELIASYAPDVVGLQECSPTSRSCDIVGIFKTYGYEEVSVNPTNSKKSNYTPLFYNPKTVKVIEGGYVYYYGTLNDSGSKSITWAVFEVLSSGKRFAVCSTHFFYQSADLGGDAGRVENAKTLVKTVKDIVAKYNVPVIAGGDLNTRTTTSAFNELTSNGLVNIQPIAKKAANSATHHTYPEFHADLGYYSTYVPPTANVYASKAIDHALVYNKGSLTFELFDIVTENFALMSSDHCPLVIDFTF